MVADRRRRAAGGAPRAARRGGARAARARRADAAGGRGCSAASTSSGCGRRATAPRRLRLAAMVVAAPLIWALSDLLVTGDALHSLHGDGDLAEAVDRRRDVVDAPYWTAQYYGYTLREPLVIGIPIGLFFAWRFRRREAILPLVVVVAMTLVFMIGPVFGLPLIGRYVRTPSVLLSLVLRPRGVRLPAARRPPRAAACGAASGSSPPRSRSCSCPGTSACSPTSSAGSTATGACTRSCARRPARRRCARRSTAAAAASPRRTTARCRTCATGSARTRAASATVAQDASPLADVLIQPRRVPLMRRFYQENFPRVETPPGYARDLPQRRVARARRAGLRHTSSSVTASWSTSRNSV